MRKAIVPLVLAVALVVGFVIPATAQTFANTFDHILTATLRTTGDATIGDDLAVGDSLTVTGAATIANATLTSSSLGAASASTLSVTGAATVGTQLSLAPQAAIVVTSGSVITPTGTFQRIEAAGAVTGVLGVPQSGQVVTLINSGSNAITIEDTTGQVFTANAVLGQWDTLTVVGYGTGWYEVARANN